MKNTIAKSAARVLANCLIIISVACAVEKPAPEQKPATEIPLTARELFERKRECFEAGQRVADRVEKSLTPGDAFLNAQYAFNENRNSCVWAGGIVSSRGIVSQWVNDTFTNETLTEYMKDRDGKLLTATTEEEFSRRKIELFREAVVPSSGFP